MIALFGFSMSQMYKILTYAAKIIIKNKVARNWNFTPPY